MQEITIKSNEAGQRFDKFLKKYLREAGSGFLYKMLRKKNITLNGKKADGTEMLSVGDQVKFFLADETIEKFRGAQPARPQTDKPQKQQPKLKIDIIYENDHILIVNKPSGVLTQKAVPADYSLNEWLIDHMLKNGQITEEELLTFRPSVCNRLDRNTSGLVICGKTLAGSQKMSELLRDRTVHKFYRLYVAGNMTKEGISESWLIKDEKTNKVDIFPSKPSDPNAVRIKTGFRVLAHKTGCSYLEVELFTGKTHQIRAHLSALGHPLIGDTKYGRKEINDFYRQKGIRSQMLHAYRLEFPEIGGIFSDLSNQTIIAPEPREFRVIE